jgi:hypothetical protein
VHHAVLQALVLPVDGGPGSSRRGPRCAVLVRVFQALEVTIAGSHCAGQVPHPAAALFVRVRQAVQVPELGRVGARVHSGTALFAQALETVQVPVSGGRVARFVVPFAPVLVGVL